MKKLYAFICAFLFLGNGFTEINELIIGTTNGYAPYVSLNEQGEYEGFDIDLANLLAKKLGRKLVLKDYGTMTSLMLALKQGKVDALIWAISITEERMQKMEMIYYQGEKVDSMPILFWKDKPEGISSFADLEGKIISVEAGTYQEAVLKKFPQVQICYTDKIIDALLEIKFRKSFATIADPSLIPYLKKQYPELQVLNLPLPLEEQSQGNGICISKTNRDLAKQVREAIQALREEGRIAELEKKWNMMGGTDG